MTNDGTSLDKAQWRYTFYFDRFLRKAHGRKNLCRWMFLDPSNVGSTFSGDETSKKIHVNEDSYKVLYLYTNTAVIQRGPLVKYVTSISSLLPLRLFTRHTPINMFPTSGDLADTNLDGEARLVVGLLKYRRNLNGTLGFLS